MTLQKILVFFAITFSTGLFANTPKIVYPTEWNTYLQSLRNQINYGNPAEKLSAVKKMNALRLLYYNINDWFALNQKEQLIVLEDIGITVGNIIREKDVNTDLHINILFDEIMLTHPSATNELKELYIAYLKTGGKNYTDKILSRLKEAASLEQYLEMELLADLMTEGLGMPKDVDQAIGLYKRITELIPNYGKPYMKLYVLAFQEKQNLQLAYSYLEEGWNDHGVVECKMQMVQNDFENGFNLERALSHVDELIDHKPEYAQAYFLKGLICEALFLQGKSSIKHVEYALLKATQFNEHFLMPFLRNRKNYDKTAEERRKASDALNELYENGVSYAIETIENYPNLIFKTQEPIKPFIVALNDITLFVRDESTREILYKDTLKMYEQIEFEIGSHLKVYSSNIENILFVKDQKIHRANARGKAIAVFK